MQCETVNLLEEFQRITYSAENPLEIWVSTIYLVFSRCIYMGTESKKGVTWVKLSLE